MSRYINAVFQEGLFLPYSVVFSLFFFAFLRQSDR